MTPSFVQLCLTAADLAAIRWTADPLREIVASLRVLAKPDQHPLHRSFQSLASRSSSDLGLLIKLVSVEGWLPSCFSTPHPKATADPHSILTTIFDADHLGAQRDLDVLRTRDGAGGWHTWTAAELLRRTGDALVIFWHEVLEPMWGRIVQITRADLAFRTGVATRDGLGVALSGLHTRIALAPPAGPSDTAETWHGSGSGVWCVPSVFQWPRITLGHERPTPIIVYPARGAARLWEPTVTSQRQIAPLRQVLGSSRVEILSCLEIPSTTTRLARHLALAPATISAHLAALERARLLTAARHGREVYYTRTSLAESLVNPDRSSAD